jgi:acetyl/propionyl-CoA carboxylase alpha subunit
VKTNAGFLGRCLEAPDFIAGDVDTGFIDANLAALTDDPEPSAAALSAAAAGAMIAGEETLIPAEPSPWRELMGFRLNAEPSASVRLFRHGQPVVAEVVDDVQPRSVLITEDDEIVVFEAGEAFAFATRPPRADAPEGAGSDGQVRAPMPGRVTALAVKPGQTVEKGQALLTLEAMKMEHALTAPFAGKVKTLAARLGDQVVEGAVLAVLEPAPPRDT